MLGKTKAFNDWTRVGDYMGRFIDLTGRKIGNLTVIERVENRITSSNRSLVRWKCLCDCGNITEIDASCLLNNSTSSCGCQRKEKIKIFNKNKLIDLTGQRFGRLTVIRRAESHISPSGQCRTMWECVCECDNTIIVRGADLKDGKVKSCGCLQEYNRQPDDLTGNKYGKLLVIAREKDEKYKNGKTKVMWLCQCDCGNTIKVANYALKYGHTKSCGCYKKERTSEICLKNLTGQRFGRLIVLERANDIIRSNSQHATQWLCRCDCGNETIVRGNVLLRGATKSCGCLTSIGEYNLINYFNNWNIKYEYQKQFDNLVGVNGGKLSYDFYLPYYNLLVECQGKQHEEPIEFFGGEMQFKIQQEHDKRKREYAEKNGYDIFEIYYEDYNKVDKIFNEYLISKVDENNV